MDYQHLYAYLETRPLDELKECMNNVVTLARKNTASLDQISETEVGIILNADKVKEELQQLRVAQRIWSLEAISGKFGMNSLDVGDCLRRPEVLSYLVHVNDIIDKETSIKQTAEDEQAMMKPVYAHISPQIPAIDIESDAHVDFAADSTVVAQRSRKHSSCGTVEGSSSTPNTIVDSPAHGKRKREHGILWTPEMDSTLLQQVLACDDTDEVDWEVAASHVGHGVSDKKCEKRWKNILEPQQRGLKKSESWTDAEVQKMFELVSEHTSPPVWLKNQQRLSEERIDWVKISQKMGRIASSCRSKWSTYKKRTMKGGPFSPAEDALIRQRVAEWGDKGMGLWASLEKEMNRADGSLIARWKTLCARVV